ncbi:hypothetical protein [Aliarcobacter butzleri]|uniref:hypothetical protein n=1 Tax=Aliarcobacter butzleri TaxID=28197 RepID=UPI001ED9F7A9|nr:hypothetical protein [Aliarcobacter butzleri]MCG3692250.1 hypothetical protein [Aliarcobacter butzleri]MCT7618364.1 hypothetical protein [Aliarcobacter butzleri]
MKKLISTIAVMFLALNLSANELTKEQLNKLNSPMVKEENNNLVIEDYNFINFKEKVKFTGKDTDKIIIKTKAIMKKDTVNKDIFVSLSSSMIDQTVNSIFLTPQYMSKIQSVGLLIDKPSSFDLDIEVNVIEKGFHISVNDGLQKQTHFIYFSQLFDFKVQ